jgi:hypothetical protein
MPETLSLVLTGLAQAGEKATDATHYSQLPDENLHLNDYLINTEIQIH